MKNKIKLLAVDIDGTLLNSKKELTTKTATTLKKIMDTGVQVIPVTGRVASGIPECIEKVIDPPYVISANGANIYDRIKKTTIYTDGLNQKYVAAVLAVVECYDCLFDVFINGTAFAEEERLLIRDRYVATEEFGQYIMDTRYGVESLKDFILAGNQEVEKINLFFSDTQSKEKAYERLRPFDQCQITSGIPTNLEITKSGIHKGKTLVTLAEQLQIKPSEIMAIGDGDNDIEMLNVAGIAVAMENGTKALKGSADYITKTNDEEGIAYAIEHFLR